MGMIAIRSRKLLAEQLENRDLMVSDLVLEWNDVMLDAIRATNTNPPRASRAMAIVHTAIYDAVNAIERTHEFFFVDELASPLSSVEAAVSAAAHATLSSLFPTQTAAFDVKLAVSLAAIPDGPPEDLGVELGENVAAQWLALRADDGDRAIVREHWSGDGDVLVVIRRIVEAADRLVSPRVIAKIKRILK